MKRLLASLVFIGGCLLISTQVKAPKCLASDPGDSFFFGDTLAVSDNYIAVGDHLANRVVLYRRNIWGGWSRMQEILPPEGSIIEKAGHGFGFGLDFHEDTLFIGANGQLRKKQPDLDYSAKTVKNFGAIYSAKLNPDEAIALQKLYIRTTDPDQGLGIGFSVSGNRLAIVVRTEIAPGKWSGKVLLHDLTTYEITRVIEAPTVQAEEGFGAAVDLYKNTLVVGSASFTQGSALVFDLTDVNPPRRIAGKAGSGAFGGGIVAQGENFTALSNIDYFGAPPPTVIVTDNGASIVLERGGALSIAGQRLSIARQTSPDLEQFGLVSVFEISPQGEAKLVLEIPHGQQAVLADEFLVFTIAIDYFPKKRKVCYCSLEKI